MDIPAPLLDRLLASGLLIRGGVDGIYLRSQTFESVVEAVDAMVGRVGADDSPEVYRFPPTMAASALAQSGYLSTFPQLLGSIVCFCGNEADHRRLLRCVEAGESWTDKQETADLVLSPAACYPLYPMVAARGPLPQAGGLYDIHSWCFRHEPSHDPARMQSFRLREFVRIGGVDQVMTFREAWLARAQILVRELALPFAIELANDPFFGRSGRLMAEGQRDQKLKYELLVQINDASKGTACCSFNYHLNHFGEAWGIRLDDGTEAHSGCVGFGLERFALALFQHHGLEPSDWPLAVRRALRWER
jgi:seryl-tRNA synthetase